MPKTSKKTAKKAEEPKLELEVKQNQALSIKSNEVAELARGSLLICEAMASVMKEGTHYGKVPGTDKPTLLQAGAQSICKLFHFVPTFKESVEKLPNFHREVTVKCFLITPDGRLLGEGVGSCSTMESKYRYRKGEAEFWYSGQVVPGNYWKLKKDGDLSAIRRLFATIMDDGESRYMARKNPASGEYEIAKIISDGNERVENPSIADQYNTVLKMAKKRALVDATLNVTAASEVFTQDVEDLEENMSVWNAKTVDMEAEPEIEKAAAKPQEAAQTVSKPKDTAGETKEQEDGKASEIQAFFDWREIPVHFRCSVQGKKLGELEITHLRQIKEWADKKVDWNSANRTLIDKKFKAALDLGLSAMEAEENRILSEQRSHVATHENKDSPDVGRFEGAEEVAQACVSRLQCLLKEQLISEEEFLKMCAQHKATRVGCPWRNLSDVDDLQWLQDVSDPGNFRALMINWGEIKA